MGKQPLQNARKPRPASASCISQAVSVTARLKPRVLQRLRSRRPARWVHLEERGDEAQEFRVIGAQPLPQRGPLRQQQLDPAVQLGRNDLGRLRRLQLPEELAVLREVLRHQAPGEHHVRRERAEDAGDPGEQGLGGVPSEEHVARPQLRQDAAQGPDVHPLVVRQAQDDLRRPVGARLHVGGQPVVQEARGPEVDQLHLAPRVGLDKDVLRFEVCVNQPKAVDVLEGNE
mmetsp:Transcript_52971/g.138049  ORF Transcript_52971/g.138049 Transcript_52971/m.138049 type:complete len:230 (+) Transcript_52971:706-1395(+)